MDDSTFDPMDPASYSDAKRGGWNVGLGPKERNDGIGPSGGDDGRDEDVGIRKCTTLASGMARDGIGPEQPAGQASVTEGSHSSQAYAAPGDVMRQQGAGMVANPYGEDAALKPKVYYPSADRMFQKPQG
jgi:hypothetical protein